MEQSAPNIENEQEMQVDEVAENNETSVQQEQVDQIQNMGQNLDATLPTNIEVNTESKETVHASTSKVNSIVTNQLIRGRSILLRKCKTKSKDLLAKLAKGFIPISLELVPKARRGKRSRRLFICEKCTVRPERTLRRKYNRPRGSRYDRSRHTRRKY